MRSSHHHGLALILAAGFSLLPLAAWAQAAGQDKPASAGQEQSAAGQQAQPPAQQQKPPADPQKPSADQQKPGEEQPPRVNTEVFVTAPRIEIPLKDNPAATTVVTQEELQSMPRASAPKRRCMLVPGVKVDNQADGERVHLSIRGQGLLTERGIRGITVLLDGLPLNDPTGFAPDLFDVDWASVQRVEVLRGLASALYGGGSSGGVINITTRDGGAAPRRGQASLDAGAVQLLQAVRGSGRHVRRRELPLHRVEHQRRRLPRAHQVRRLQPVRQGEVHGQRQDRSSPSSWPARTSTTTTPRG